MNGMWICPKCHQKFINKNQYHSCGNYTLDDFLKGKSEKAIELFNHFLSAFREVGDFELHPVKTRVTLLTKMRFASINRLSKDCLSGHLILDEKIENSLIFTKIDKVGNNSFVHHFKLREKSDINAEFKKYMKKSYKIGSRE